MDKINFKVPADLYKAMEANSKAKAQWKNLGPIARRDFITWIDATKQSQQTKARAGQVCVLLAAGKQGP